ncbi:hypothetical protein M404DRAFT_991421 [Pisolithus tinctorius Marx 270]|uniref:Uncharacterized protein n=1 Tax=Pisolithus tinctorius Marx 270 TaxID=870435 RepID=A0A0C3PZ74_PISTI|nr:hypothetical protein M404DRAFT_991421 [Pisolithus tinctorius Marx 270]
MITCTWDTLTDPCVYDRSVGVLFDRFFTRHLPTPTIPNMYTATRGKRTRNFPRHSRPYDYPGVSQPIPEL